MRLERVEDLADLGGRAATAVIDLCRERQAEGAIPCIVLTGGRAGAALLTALGEHPAVALVNWRRVRFLWGDERWVPSGDAERNDRLADEGLFATVDTDPSLIHRVAVSDGDRTLAEAAADYADVVAGVESIDLAVNGVGEDGHVASLFPDRPEPQLVDAETPQALPVTESPKPPAERVTLSVPALRRADRIWFFAVGAGKADAVRRIVERRADEDPLPAEIVARGRDATLWADAEALGLLSALPE
ncbi:MAG: 6-phosphogluconolactonase [Leucobacter sp.]